MNTLIVPLHTVVDGMPIGRRTAEIMKEKGAYYSGSAMATRLGINRETLRMMLKGERSIYTFEIDKIAADLKLSVARILQEDVSKLAASLQDMLKSKHEPEAALDN